MGNCFKFPIQIIEYDKRIAHMTDINTALLYAELKAEYDACKYFKTLDELGGFETSTEYIQDQTGLSYYQQKKALDNLQKLKLITATLSGIPPKKHIKFNESEETI